MLSLFILILFGVGVAVFATQNAQATSLVFGPYGVAGVPIYAVVLASMLFGIFVSWLISLVGWVSTSMTLRGKEGRIRDVEKQVHLLEQRNQELEEENNHLRGRETVIESEPEERHNANPFVKIRQRFS